MLITAAFSRVHPGSGVLSKVGTAAVLGGETVGTRRKVRTVAERGREDSGDVKGLGAL